MSEDAMDECWLPIPGFEDYEISDRGRIWSIERVVETERGSWHLPGRFLRPSPNTRGYLQVTLRRRGERLTRRVHRLVLEAFVGPCPPGMEACHGPGGKLDNRSSNLRWDTRSENNLDHARHGTHHLTKRTHCPRRHELIEANIPRAWRIKGQRTCLACMRARAEGAARRRRGKDVPDLYATADAHFARIVAAR